MVRRHNRLLVAFYVCSDAILGVAAFVLAYVLRFESGLIPTDALAINSPSSADPGRADIASA